MLPKLSSQTMSVLLSPLKSPVPPTNQVVGTLPITVADVMAAPFISQITRLRNCRPEHIGLAVAVEIASAGDGP